MHVFVQNAPESISEHINIELNRMHQNLKISQKMICSSVSCDPPQGCSQDFHQGGAQLERVVVRCKAAYGHRGWVREGDAPPPAEGRSFWHF